MRCEPTRSSGRPDAHSLLSGGISETVVVTVTVMAVTPTCQVFDQAAALFGEYRSHFGQPPSPEATRAWLSEQLTQERMSLAAGVDGASEVAAFITTTVMPASLMLGTMWSIRDLFVAPRHRRAGIAYRLIQHVVTNAREAGALRVSVQTETDNASALALYAAVGFQPVDGLELLNLALVPE
jgi:GNAT superfamily N-acetyltransferase